MSRNNSVTKVLATSGNSAILAAGQTLDNLAEGQPGIFDANTQLSLDATSNPVKDFFIAVGTDGGEDINVSAGQYIQRNKVVGYQYREHTAGQPMIVKIGDYKAKCDSDYTVRIEFRNQEIYRTQGFNGFTKAYSLRTACCDTCDDCPSGDANEITKKLIEAVNADTDGLVNASAVTRSIVTTAVHGTSTDYGAGAEITDADIDALIAFNELASTDADDRVFTDVLLTAIDMKINKYCAVNLKFFAFRQNLLIVSLVDGFDCTGVVTTEQELVFEEGTGYNVAQKEWKSNLQHSVDPYVLNSTGVATDFTGTVDKSKNYDQLYIENDFESQMEGTPYLNQMTTLMAFPITDTTTRNSFIAAMDVQIANDIVGFDALADDGAASDADAETVSPTEDNTEDTDGIA